VRQFVLPDSWDRSRACRIEGREARRLSSVLRLVPGDSFPAIDRDGARYSCTIASSDRSGITISVNSMAESGPEGYLPDIRTGHGSRDTVISAGLDAGAAVPPGLPRIILATGILKGSKLDEVARIATEAGVSSIIPLVTSRSVPAIHAAARLERVRRIIDEAIGQSGSPVPTRMTEPMTPESLCKEYAPVKGSRLCLFFHEAPLAQASIHRYCTGVHEEIVACVGPEGGFDDAEIRALYKGGFLPAWLGPTVLRAETAAVFAVASLRIVCLERSSWSMTESNE